MRAIDIASYLVYMGIGIENKGLEDIKAGAFLMELPNESINANQEAGINIRNEYIYGIRELGENGNKSTIEKTMPGGMNINANQYSINNAAGISETEMLNTYLENTFSDAETLNKNGIYYNTADRFSYYDANDTAINNSDGTNEYELNQAKNIDLMSQLNKANISIAQLNRYSFLQDQGKQMQYNVNSIESNNMNSSAEIKSNQNAFLSDSFSSISHESGFNSYNNALDLNEYNNYRAIEIMANSMAFSETENIGKSYAGNITTANEKAIGQNHYKFFESYSENLAEQIDNSNVSEIEKSIYNQDLIAGGNSSNLTNNVSVNLNSSGNSGMDPYELAELIGRQIAMEVASCGGR